MKILYIQLVSSPEMGKISLAVNITVLLLQYECLIWVDSSLSSRVRFSFTIDTAWNTGEVVKLCCEQ